MPRLTGPQKLDRVLRFLVALREQALAGPLVAAGMTDGDLEEGWSLLRAASPKSIAHMRSPPIDVTDALSNLDLFVRRHVRTVEPAILRRFPALHHALYETLPEETGAGIILTVLVFLERLERAWKEPDGPALRELLRTRGLDGHALEEARRWVHEAQGGDATSDTATRAEPDYAKAEADAWAWFGEWATVARARVRNGRVLLRLGLTPDARSDDG